MSFLKPKKFVPSTNKELREYSRRAREKEKQKPVKITQADLEKRYRIQVKKCANNNASLLRILAGKPSKVVKRNREAFLKMYFERLRYHKGLHEEALAKNPKITFYTKVDAPVLDRSQPGQFCYEVEGAWGNFNWDDMGALLIVATGKHRRLPEFTTTAELTKRAMRQILGFVETKSGFTLASPKATFKLWEPLRKEIMGKKSKKKLREQIEAIDEKPRKKKRVEAVEDLDEDEVPKKKKSKELKKELAGKTSKKEKLNGHKRARAPNLKDDDRLKPVGTPEYTKGMGEVWELIPRKGITAADFFKAAKKARLDALRTRQYLSIMRREGTVVVRN